MQRWAHVTINESGTIYDGHGMWVNESNVASMIHLDDGCMICFATSDDDAVKVKQSIDYIFTEWDDWQAVQEGSD